MGSHTSQFKYFEDNSEKIISLYLIDFDNEINLLSNFFYLNNIALDEFKNVILQDESKKHVKLIIQQADKINHYEIGDFNDIKTLIDKNREINFYYPILIMYSIFQSYFIQLFYFCSTKDDNFKNYIRSKMKVRYHQDHEVFIKNIINRGFKSLKKILEEFFMVSFENKPYDENLMSDFIEIRHTIAHFNGKLTQTLINKINYKKRYPIIKNNSGNKINIHKKNFEDFRSNMCLFIGLVDQKVVEYLNSLNN